MICELAGTVGGGLKLNIIGSGYSNETQIKICDNDCTLLQSNMSHLQCMVSFIIKKQVFSKRILQLYLINTRYPKVIIKCLIKTVI